MKLQTIATTLLTTLLLTLFVSACSKSGNENLVDNNETNTTTQIDSNPLKSIKVTISKNSLNVDENATLNAIATYENNSTKDVTEEVEWIGTDEYAFKVNQHTLQAKKDVNILLHAELNNITSNSIALEIYQEINGHRLPPEPDPIVNNSTLLGIDVNNNGVRDDVERRIYTTYKRPIEQAYMMQDAKWYPQTLEDPVVAAKSKSLEKENWNLYSCNGYLEDNVGIKISDKSVTFMENAYFNTKERMRAYIEFNEAMSGGVYHIPMHDEDFKRENCDFNITEMLEMEK